MSGALRIGPFASQEARAGDLVIVRDGDGRECLAAVDVVVCASGIAVVRRWLAESRKFCVHSSPVIGLDRILRLAPDDETTAAARASLTEGAR